MTDLSVKNENTRGSGWHACSQLTADKKRMNAHRLCVQSANNVATFTQTCMNVTFSEGHMENTAI